MERLGSETKKALRAIELAKKRLRRGTTVSIALERQPAVKWNLRRLGYNVVTTDEDTMLITWRRWGWM